MNKQVALSIAGVLVAAMMAGVFALVSNLGGIGAADAAPNVAATHTAKPIVKTRTKTVTIHRHAHATAKPRTVLVTTPPTTSAASSYTAGASLPSATTTSSYEGIDDGVHGDEGSHSSHGGDGPGDD